MRGSPWRDRFRYWFDGWMSRGIGAILALLALATAVFVLLLGGITWLVIKFAAPPGFGAPEPGDAPWDYLWDVLIGTLFPGGTGSEVGWGFRILMFVIAVGGLLFGASLIGLITGGFQRRVDILRKGRSRVLERDHTVILGWSPKVITIVQEIAIANASRRRPAIVILADKDKVEMEDEIRERAGSMHGTRVICRTGDIRRRSDLELVSVDLARSVILLGEPGPDHDNDTIKAAYALTHIPHAPAHVVGELVAERKVGVAQIAGGPSVQWLLGSDLIGRILVQTCRQTGLSAIYQELLNFDGTEIYITRQPELEGATFYDAQRAFPECTAIGLVRGGVTMLNPAHDTVIGSNDDIIVLAEDDSTIRLGSIDTFDLAAALDPKPTTSEPERTLMLGGGERLATMLRELDDLVAPGSRVHIVSAGVLPSLPPMSRVEVSLQQADPTDQATLVALNLADFDHVIVMPETDAYPVAHAESRTLVTLLLLHDAMSRLGFQRNIVVEMLDDANRELAVEAGVKDFIASDRLVALALAQLSENPRLRAVFNDLFNAEGVEIYLRPATDYVATDVEVPFAVVLEAANRRNETAIGYRIGGATDANVADGRVRLNPAKAEQHRYTSEDSIIVIG